MKGVIPLLTLLICIQLSTQDLIWMADVANPGARYPLNDLYDGNQTADQRGQLNSVGMRQQYLLGSYLRADYIDKLGLVAPKYNPNTIEVFACNVDRTIDSALARTYGVFPPGTGWKIPEEVTDPEMLEPPFNVSSDSLKRLLRFQALADETEGDFALDYGFQPVPVFVLEDILNDPCPNAGVLYTARFQEVAKTISSFQASQSIFISKMKLVFNLTALQLTIPTLADLYDTVLSDLTLNRDLPKGFDEQFDFKTLKYISDYYNTLIYDGNYGKTFSILLLSAIKDKMELARLHQMQKKWSMFFTKEGTISPLMTTLNLTSTECLTQRFKNQTITALNCMDPPTFSSNLLIELHEDDAFEHYIQVKYNGEYVYLCEKKSIKCQYHQFWSRVPSDRNQYQTQCYGK